MPHWPPYVSLFHPCSNEFQVNMKELTPKWELYEMIRKLVAASASLDDMEATWVISIDESFTGLLGSRFMKSDGVIIHLSAAENAALWYVRLRMRFGRDVRIYTINVVLLIKSIGQLKLVSSLFHSLLTCMWQKTQLDLKPTVLLSLALAGPWLCVIGAVYSVKVIIEPLT